MERLDAEGRLHFTKNGGIRSKVYMDELPGMPAQALWTNINPVNSQAEGYRAMMKVDKRTAEDIKHRLPCITPSVQLKGNSKKLTDFQKETYWLMLDYDDVPPENIATSSCRLSTTARTSPLSTRLAILSHKAK